MLKRTLTHIIVVIVVLLLILAGGAAVWFYRATQAHLMPPPDPVSAQLGPPGAEVGSGQGQWQESRPRERAPFIAGISSVIEPGNNDIEIQILASLRDVFVGKALAGDPKYSHITDAGRCGAVPHRPVA